MSNEKKPSKLNHNVPLPKPRRNKVLPKHARDAANAQKKAAKQAIIDAKKIQKKAEARLNSIAAIDEALHGTGSPIIHGEDLELAAPRMKKHIEAQDIIFKANPGPQEDFLAATETEVFYGGARGGGKSYAMLVDPLRFCNNPKFRGLLIRRTMPELREIIFQSQLLYPKAYPNSKWREQDKMWRFPSGARLEFGYAENLQDALRYQGQAYTWIGVDELPQYPTPEVWNMLRSSLRAPRAEGAEALPTYMRATGNPGNIGSFWVREMFIDPAIPNTRFTEEVTINDPTGPRTNIISRRFIPAKVWDNPYLTRDDSYVTMLSTLPETLRKQFLEGDWDIFDNMAFPDFNKDIHVITPFSIPESWIKFRACDWGYSSPACCLWFAIDYDNNLYVYREIYQKGNTADVFAHMVLDAEMGENIRYGVLDASAWAQRGDIGPSIAETMVKEGCRWSPSDRSLNSRRNGKLEVHRRLQLVPSINKPRLRIFDTCRNLIRTMPQLPVDENKPEDVDTHAEDHAYDALRYGVISRPLNPKVALAKSGVMPKPADSVLGY